MIGRRRPQAGLFDVGNVFPLQLAPNSFHAQLAQAAPRLFRDEDFAVFYSERTGRPSVPPSQLALITVLHHEAGCSDAEAVARSAYDLRWAAVLRRSAGEALCAKSTFQLFRAHLVLHDEVRRIFQRSIEEARRAGLLGGKTLRISVDTKPIIGRGAVQDTYNLLGTGIEQLARCLARLEGKSVEQWARENDLGRYFGSSLKGSVEIDWADAEARNQFLAEIVTDARRLLRLAGTALGGAPACGSDEGRGAAVREAAQLLEQLLLQDVVEIQDNPSRGQAAAVEGTAKGRIPSTRDPDQRHGRKSKKHRFTGHKASVATDVESQIILDADVLPGDAPDAQGLLEQVKRVEENTGEPVQETIGDCAYGSGATRQQFADAGRSLQAKVPQEPENNGFFPKRAFVLDMVGDTVICPGWHIADQFRTEPDGTKVFQFGYICKFCTLQRWCTEAKSGRTIRVHPQEGLLQQARTYQETPEGRETLRKRQGVENALARLAHRAGALQGRGRRAT